MKKLLLAAAALTGLYSCSEDFEVAAPYQNYTFAYSLLNMEDTAHYVRIQKAFLDENKSAIDMATIADSSFYNNLNVYVLELDTINKIKTDSIVLTRVDYAAEGFPKDSGAFFTQPNYAYKFKKALNPARKYRLVINNPTTNTIGSSEISIINTVGFKAIDQKEILFLRMVNPSNGTDQITRITSTIPDNSTFADAVIRFRYVEDVNGARTPKYVDFSIPYVESSSSNSIGLEVVNKTIFNFLGAAIGPAGAGVNRYLDSCDVIINAGGEDFYNFIRNQQGTGGLTGDLTQPLFTNFTGNNIYGLFSTRATRVSSGIYLGKNMVDSLRANPATSRLNFIAHIADM